MSAFAFISAVLLASTSSARPQLGGIGQAIVAADPLANLVGGLGINQAGNPYAIDGYLVADVLGPLGCKADYAVGIIGNLTLAPLLNLCYCIEIAGTDSAGTPCPPCQDHASPVCEQGSCDCTCNTGYYEYIDPATGVSECRIRPECNAPGQAVSDIANAQGFLTCICAVGLTPGGTSGGCIEIPGPVTFPSGSSTAPINVVTSSTSSSGTTSQPPITSVSTQTTTNTDSALPTSSVVESSMSSATSATMATSTGGSGGTGPSSTGTGTGTGPSGTGTGGPGGMSTVASSSSIGSASAVLPTQTLESSATRFTSGFAALVAAGLVAFRL